MRVMVTYYDGYDILVKDMEVESIAELLSGDAINSVVEVTPGVDYDKEGYKESLENGDFPLMLFKHS